MMFECIDKIYPSVSIDTVTGSICNFTDDIGGLPLKSCTSLITGYQEGSGTPSPDNVRPLHAWSGANLTACGTNLWDEEWAVSGSGIKAKNLIPVLPNTTYYFKSPCNVTAYKYDNEKNSLGLMNITKNYTFTTASNQYYMWFDANGYGSTTYNNDISINYPSTDTSYHAYNGNTYIFTFGQSIYQGSIDWKRGVVVGTWGMVDLGTLDWFPISNAYYADIAGKKNGIGNLLCSSYPIYTATPSLSDMPDKMIKGGSVDNMAYVKDSSYPDAASFKTAMNGVQLAYELATPIEIPLGGINLLTQEGQNNIFADCGDTTVEYIKIV